MKTVADLTFDDFRKIGKDAAEKAVADLRSAGHIASAATAKTEAEQPLAKVVRRPRGGAVTSRFTEIHVRKALRYEKS